MPLLMQSLSRESINRIRRVTRDGRFAFGEPIRIICARSIEEVVSALAEVEAEAIAGRLAVGFVSYEAAAAFDEALVTHMPGSLPLIWFAVYDNPPALQATATEPGPRLEWRPAISPAEYREALNRIREWIAAGDTYQVNFTYPLSARFDADAVGLFDALVAAQPTDHGLFIDTDEFAILSVSPELFFRLDRNRIECRPMKGTAPRGLWPADDARRAHVLRESEKERAENVMIVDMVRNDLGRIADVGSVRVSSLFDTQRLETCWQMTSTVEARTAASLPEIFRALFPSASVTGAPKVRTMQIIRDLEPSPRGVYCGAIGWVGPGRAAEFSVGIRTVMIERRARCATYHVGSGVTWDSAPQAEFDECRLKSAVLTHRCPEFKLIESLRWDRDYFLLDGHLERVRASAEYFGFSFNEKVVRAALEQAHDNLHVASKVRLTLARDGRIEVESVSLPATVPARVMLSPEPVDFRDVFLYHKTTQRSIYDRARDLIPDADDVILWNERGELTESTVANLALRTGEVWFTPPVSSGLLGGVFREHLLREGRLRERILTVSEIFRADEICLINSVRKWIPAMLLDAPSAAPERVTQ